MKLKYFKESGYYELFDSIDNNIDRYTAQDSSWLNSFFDKTEFAKESSVNAVLPELYGDKFENDLVNVRLIYDSLKDVITPKQASNELLWSYLTHFRYWNYTVSRWSTDKMTASSIRTRFFCGNTKSGKADRVGLLRNSISRLFWLGFLSYKEEYRNKYELTELLLSKSDLCLSIIERNFSMNKTITCGILLGIKKYQEEKGTEIVENEWRSLCKYINRYGAVAMLDIMSEEEIKQLSYAYLTKKDNE